MSTVIDEKKYAALLRQFLPRVIETKREYERMSREAGKLFSRSGSLTPEESEMLNLLTTIIEYYEKKHFMREAESVTPLEMLEFLMESRGHSAKDLWEIVADKGTVSKILSGQRSISKAQAKKLSALYSVSAALFI